VVVLDRCRAIALHHVRLGKAVVSVEGVRIHLDVQREERYGVVRVAGSSHKVSGTTECARGDVCTDDVTRKVTVTFKRL